MTYRNSHNDPTTQRVVKSPEAVRAMLAGGDPAVDLREAEGAVTWEDIDSVRFLDMPHTMGVFKDEFDSNIARCHTCGRAWDCACSNCPYCVGGVPKSAGGEQERYG